MATTVHEPSKIDLDRLPSQGSGNGGGRNPVPAGGDLRRIKPSSPPPARRSTLNATSLYWHFMGALWLYLLLLLWMKL